MLRPRTPRRETSLAIFIVLAQASAGTAITGEVFARTVPIRWVALGLLLAAFAAAAFHLGRPRGALFALANLRSSWLSREILAGTLFGIAVALDARPVAALLGVVFVYAMSRVYRIRTIPAWDRRATTAAFFLTTLVLGGVASALLGGLTAQ